MPRRRRPGAFLFLLLWAWQGFLLVAWLQRDTRPPRWDQSVHLATAWSYKQAFAAGSLSGLMKPEIWPGHPAYPPVAHYAMAPLMALAPALNMPVEDAAAPANLLFIALLSWGAFLLASFWWGRGAGFSAAFLITFLPPVLEYAREPMVDLALTAFVVLAYACWVRSGHFTRWGWTLGLGLAGGLGMLSKWTFPLYVLPIFVDALARAAMLKGRDFLRALAAFGVALALCAPWYAVNLLNIVPRVMRAAGQGLQEGDPVVGTLASWLWYPRVVELHLFPLGAVVAAAGLLWLLFRRPRGSWVLLAWLLSGYLVWSLVSNKNDRYFLPVLVVLPLAVAALPYHIPKTLSLGAVFFSAWYALGPATSSFASPPREQAWPLEAMLGAAAAQRDPAAPVSILTLVSNHEYMNGNNLRWTAAKMGLGSRVIPRSRLDRPGQLTEFVLVKTGSLGPAYTIDRHEKAREEILSPQGWFQKAFEKSMEWGLPDGGQAVLFRRRSAAPAVTLSPADALPKLIAGLSLRGAEVRSEPSARYPGETAVRLTAAEASVKGLSLTDVNITLDGFWAARDDAGEPRLLRLRRAFIESARLSEESATVFLRGRAKNLKDAAVTFLPGNRVQVTGRLKDRPVTLLARLEYGDGPEDPSLAAEVLQARIGPLRLPSRGGRVYEKTIPLKPQKGMPFTLGLSGLKTRAVEGGGAPGFLGVSPQ